MPPELKPSSAAEDLVRFFDRQEELLLKEEQAEVQRTELLASNASFELLAQRGLCINGLSVSGVSIGLGGKSMVTVHRSIAFNVDTILPTNVFRPGEPVRLLAQEATRKASSKASKDEDRSQLLEGIVAKASDSSITIAISTKEGDELDLPERCRLLKTANTATYDRMQKAISRIRRLLVPPPIPVKKVPVEAQEETPSVDVQTLSLDEPAESISTPPLTEAAPIPSRPPLPDHLSLPLLKFLFGVPVSDDNAREAAPISWIDDRLNDIQKDAIQYALDASFAACIHGPPGTGKTQSLVEIIRQLVQVQKKRVLVCGASNLSVDNLLVRLSPLFPPTSITRVGHPARVLSSVQDRTLDYQATHSDSGAIVRDIRTELDGHLSTLSKGRKEKGSVKGKERGKVYDEVKALRQEYRKRESKVVKTVLSESRIVLATCHTAGSRSLNDQTFDVVLIDEATQALEAVSYIPILKASKLILAGDPNQLPPTIMSISSKSDASCSSSRLVPLHSLETTLFERLEQMYGSGVKRLLAIQYRMNNDIASYPSSSLYESKLIADSSVATRTLATLPGVSDSADAQEYLECTVRFIDTAGLDLFDRGDEEGSKVNENEADLVQTYLRNLVSLGVPASAIGVLAPYSAQVSLLSQIVKGEFPETLVGTIDSLQGQEREVIIISLVRSNPKREVGFLAEKRRLNVAMTRAKRHLCVVGDSSTVANGSAYLKGWMEWLEEKAEVVMAGEIG